MEKKKLVSSSLFDGINFKRIKGTIVISDSIPSITAPYLKRSSKMNEGTRLHELKHRAASPSLQTRGSFSIVSLRLTSLFPDCVKELTRLLCIPQLNIVQTKRVGWCGARERWTYGSPFLTSGPRYSGPRLQTPHTALPNSTVNHTAASVPLNPYRVTYITMTCILMIFDKQRGENGVLCVTWA